eukprot:2742952-Amphidinium_carterae.5
MSAVPQESKIVLLQHGLVKYAKVHFGVEGGSKRALWCAHCVAYGQFAGARRKTCSTWQDTTALLVPGMQLSRSCGT